jgi:DNA-binding IclR family transcriptional regulator
VTDSAVKSAKRAFEILEAFSRHRRPLALKELLDELDYPASSGSALMKSLVALGYLDYDGERRTYFPTMRIAALGSWVPGVLFGDGQLLGALEDLHRETGETVILAVQSDLHAQYVHVIPSPEPLQLRVPPGTRRPLAQSGLGLVLLSAKRDPEIERLRRRINASGEGAALTRGRDDGARQRGAGARLRLFAECDFTRRRHHWRGLAERPVRPGVRRRRRGQVERLERKEEEIVAALKTMLWRLAA